MPIRVFFWCLDVFLIGFSGLVAFFLKGISTADGVTHYALAIGLAAVLGVLLFEVNRGYRPFRQSSWTDYLRSCVLGWLSLTVCLALLAFFTKTGMQFSREWFADWMLLGFGLTFFSRWAMWFVLKQLRARGWNQRRVVVMGRGAFLRQVCEKMQHEKLGYENVGIWDLDETPLDEAGVHAWLANHTPDEVWFAVSVTDWPSIKGWMPFFRLSPVNIRILPDMQEFPVLNYSMGMVSGLPVLNLRSTPMQGFNRFVKALEDRMLSALILLLISPVMLAIALAVKLSSPGPVFYVQRRYGWGGKPIFIYKFRSMRVSQEEEGFIPQATQNDERITTVGRILRRTSLDELPQFFNVLLGEMSIVGPRPHAVSHNEHYKMQIQQYMQRHLVKPGITGWAQVNGFRGETDTLEKMEKRIEYDLYYIEHWSLWFDVKIILLTILKGFRHKNAY